MSCTPLGTTTPNLGLCKPAQGEAPWDVAINGNWDLIDAQFPIVPRSYLAGLQMSNDATINTRLDIAVGTCRDNGNVNNMTLSAAIVKDLAVAWAVGNNQGGLFAGTVTQNTTFHVFVIKRTDTNVVDVGMDTSAVAANIPAPYSAFRRIGSIRTSAAATSIVSFQQDGDYFRLLASVKDADTTNPGAAAVTQTLGSVPTGVNMQAFLNVGCINTGGTLPLMYVSDLSANDEAPSNSAAPLSSLYNPDSGILSAWPMLVRTNTSAQIRYRMSASDANLTVRIVTLGWWDTRGRNA